MWTTFFIIVFINKSIFLLCSIIDNNYVYYNNNLLNSTHISLTVMKVLRERQRNGKGIWNLHLGACLGVKLFI